MNHLHNLAIDPKSVLQLLIDDANVWLFVIDAENGFLFSSPSCDQITGYSADEFLADRQLLSKLIHPDDRERYLAHIHDNHVHRDDIVFRITHRDGGIRWIAHHCYPYGEQGLRGGINRDITAKMATESQLRKLSLAVEQSPVSVLITDLKGRIEYVNAAFTAVTGYSPAEVIGKNPSLLQSGLTSPATYSALWSALLRGEPWYGEMINRRKNGEIFIEDERIVPITQPDGSITHFLAIKQDVTEQRSQARELEHHRKHLQELVDDRTLALRHALEAADAANHAKSAFLSTMSHEIRTPMNGVLGLTHLLRASGLNDKQRDMLDKLEDAGRHLLAILNDVLDLSKIEAGRLVLEQIPVDPDALLANVASMLSERAASKRLAFQIESDPLPMGLLGDPTRLRQALLNYASNAIKFTRQGGITLRVRLKECGPESVWLRFEVADTGIGISPQQLQELFKPFTQADSTITRRHGGSGLGLAITRQLAQAMGGEAGAESVEGQGSTFWFTARLSFHGNCGDHDHASHLSATAFEGPSHGNTAKRLDLSGFRILLVEDDRINQMVAREFLSDFHCSIQVADNGLVALELLGQQPFDLVLMDMIMPEMDGLEATRQLRQMDSCKQIPVIAMTANAFDEDRHRCLAAGMDDFVAKPFDPTTLVAVLQRWLSEGKQARW